MHSVDVDATENHGSTNTCIIHRFLSLKAFRAVVHRSLQRRCVTTSLPGEAGGYLSTPEVTVDEHVLLSLLKVTARCILPSLMF
jgi:hypothetical protein